MFDVETDREEKALADALIAAVGDLDDDAQRSVETYMRAGEWAEAGISLLFFAAAQGRPVQRTIVDSEAVRRWAGEVGGLATALDKIPAA